MATTNACRRSLEERLLSFQVVYKAAVLARLKQDLKTPNREGDKMKIFETLKKTGAAVAVSDFNQTDLGLRLKTASIAAILKGIGTTEWETYMKIFADNQAQLDRLTIPAANDPTWIRESRAYIVSNAICGAITTTRTHLLVDERIDDGVDSAPNAAFIAAKPLTIPNV
jgi:hypothetical protein